MFDYPFDNNKKVIESVGNLHPISRNANITCKKYLPGQNLLSKTQLIFFKTHTFTERFWKI